MIRAFITVGLGFGDEGKGAITDYLCRVTTASLCVRYSGGAQCAHNVISPNGEKHAFGQFGAGTFNGTPTWLGPQVIIDPIAMRNEAAALSKVWTPPFEDMFRAEVISAHPKCLVTTPYHVGVNAMREVVDEHGSCGMGIGETRHYWLKYGQDAIFAEDLREHTGDTLRDKLELMRQRFLADVLFCETVKGYPRCYAAREMLSWSPIDIAKRLTLPQLKLYREPYQLHSARTRSGLSTIVFEGAQGVLLDENYGFHPHTTWSTVTQRFALELCMQWGISDITTIGITRCYMTRHGLGPFPTEIVPADRSIADIRLNTMADDGNPEHVWQGKMRFGVLDLPLLKYAAKVVREESREFGTSTRLDYLAVNCMDQLPDSVVACFERRIDSHRADHKPADDLERSMLWEPISNYEMRTRVVSDTDILTDLAEIAPIGIIGRGPGPEDRECRIPLGDLVGVGHK